MVRLKETRCNTRISSYCIYGGIWCHKYQYDNKRKNIVRLRDINNGENTYTFDGRIRQQCREYIDLVKGHYLVKNLPSTYVDLQKVKVRHRNIDTTIESVFETATQENNITKRAIFGYSKINCPLAKANESRFYIYPINGFKFMYCSEVKNSTTEYKKLVDTLFESSTNLVHSIGIAADVLKYSYTFNQNLYDGIVSGAEIIIYDIPYYYISTNPL